jgi:hypothetical protein
MQPRRTKVGAAVIAYGAKHSRLQIPKGHVVRKACWRRSRRCGGSPDCRNRRTLCFARGSACSPAAPACREAAGAGLSKASAHQSAAPAGGQHYRATAERACGDARLSFEISVVEPSKGNAHWQFADPRPKASQHITIRVAAPNAMRR